MERHRIGIVIPALNEAQTIAAIVKSVSGYGVPIVVDDGSQDETSARARESGAKVVKHGLNQGYDEALNSGFIHASELGCEYVITIDADGQHNPTILEGFIDALDDGADVVVGVRDRRARLAESIFAWVTTCRWGIRDPLCGMKGYRMSVWKELGHFDSYKSIGTELTIFAATRRKRVTQLFVQTQERQGPPRFGRGFIANWRIIRAFWIGMFHCTRL